MRRPIAHALAVFPGPSLRNQVQVSHCGDGLMKDDVQLSQTPIVRMHGADVQRLAQRAIDVIAGMKPKTHPALEERLHTLCEAFLASDGEIRHEVLEQMREDGISGTDLIDVVIPATARLMGDRWMADDISFADVSIGAARLQEAVRALASRDHNGRRRNAKSTVAPDILLVLPRGEDHSLGIHVAADQFRRFGCDVTVAVDRNSDEIAALVKKRAFALVGISVSGRRTLASAKVLVEKIRATSTRVTPIMIGGTGLGTQSDVLLKTGADHLAQDARTALAMCGLSSALATGSERRLEKPGSEGEDATAVKDDMR